MRERHTFCTGAGFRGHAPQIAESKSALDVVIGGNILACRCAKHFTAEHLASAADITLSDLYRYERGWARPSAEALVAIASCLNVSLSELFFRDECRAAELGESAVAT